jgi:putative DNA primase/helicase
MNPVVDHDAIERHLRLLFGTEASGYVCLRGIGEKGTAREGVFREDIFLEPGVLGWDKFVSAVIFHATRWGQHDVATFVVPCTLKDDRGTAENCDVFRTVCADFDTGDTQAKLAFVEQHFGAASFVVLSGGMTEEGMPKRHAYWQVQGVTVPEVVAIRDAIARKAGGDIQFGLGVDGNPYGRAHQPIRLAGSIHGKNGVRRLVEVERHHPGYLCATPCMNAKLMPASEWAIAERPADPMTTPEGPAAVDLLTAEVKAGGEGAITRWSAFNGVAGHYIHTARIGKMTLDAARLATFGWMQANMVPPWNERCPSRRSQSLRRARAWRCGPPTAGAWATSPRVSSSSTSWSSPRPTS